MTDLEFFEFMKHFKAFWHEEDLSRVQMMMVTLAKSVEMDDLQFALLFQTILEIEKTKNPSVSNKAEFDRIMRGFGK